MTWREDLERFNDKLDLSKKFPGYFDKRLFFVAIGLMVILFFATLFTNGWGGEYLSCPKDANLCVNTLYSPSCKLGEMCSVQYLQPGETIGKRPNFLAENSGLLLFLILAGTFVVNHLEYKSRGAK